MKEFTPTDRQAAVLDEIREWVRAPRASLADQYKYLAGYAGTGKTSIARFLLQDFKIAFCAFTGKAASVLRDKGCANATTLHKLIYRPNEKVARATDGTQVWTTEFVARDDSPLAEIDLVVLDECSMVDARMAQDLLSFGKKVLVLGDPFQLPPVSGEGYFVKKEPNWLLTEVHRQAAESGILRLATDIREGRGIGAPGSYGAECAIVSLEEASDREEDLLAWCDVVLVGTHRMRHHFNNQYRAAAGRRGPYPEEGEQLVCLQNNHRLGLLNGGLWGVEADSREAGHLKIEALVKSLDVDGQRLLAEIWSHDFLGLEEDLLKLPWARRAERARFAYGYALTVHKFQGSEADDVLVIDESSTFRESAAQWLYTACTRAAKRLVLVRR